ncbi:type VII secretion AAA-ATPase EccA [Mycolicibacterium fortuitum]|uniref:type VII secretion AAA-ATPase EccA n=1 Tax=Mycolicibacterium fortuitum TaxID=1766 RepID=UPI003AAD36F1
MTDTATQLFADSCIALGAEVYGRRQIPDKRVARSGFERLTAQFPDQCDGWLGLAASGEVRRDVLENAYRAIDTAGELIGGADVAVDAVDFTFDTGLYIQLPARGAEGLTLAMAAARIADKEFGAAQDLIDQRLLSSQPLFASWMLAVIYFKAKRWHDVRRVLAPLAPQINPADQFLHQAVTVAQGLSEAYLGMWDQLFDRLAPMGRGPIPTASADALLTAGMSARALERPDEATTLLNEAYAVDGIDDATRSTIATALSDPGYGIMPTTAARIDARTDYWDANTEPGERDFVRQLGAERRSELNAEADAELAEFVGMIDVKEQILRLESSAIADKRRAARGLPVRHRFLHLLLKGPPGTGKTAIARVIAKKLAAADVLPSETFVEVSRGDLVDKVIGGSENKIKQKIDHILEKGGGALFIDEAYMLTDSGSDNDFGPMVIGELLPAMANHADKLMVIAAGYADKMQEFVDSNDGLRSRFTRSITLPSYTVDELVEITVLKASQGGSIIEDLQPLRDAYTQLSKSTALDTTGKRRAAPDVLGNGRFAEKLIGFAEEERDYRLRKEGKGDDATDEELQTITGDDLHTALSRELARARDEQGIELSSETTGEPR